MRTRERKYSSPPHWIRLAVTMVFLAALVSACSTDTSSPSNAEGDERTDTDSEDVGTEDATESDDLFEMAITVSNHPVAEFSPPFVVAMEEGYFEDEGIRITEIIGGSGGGTPVRSVLSADLPFGVVSTPAAANAYLTGAPLTMIAGSVSALSNVGFVTTPDSDLEDIEDLVGGSIGYTSRGSVAEVALFMSLERAGIDPDSLETPALGGLGGALTALESGGVDASLNITAVYEQSPDDYKVLWWTDEYVPEYQQVSIIANDQILADRPEIVRGFLAALHRANEFIANDPATAAEYWAKESESDAEALERVLIAMNEANFYNIGFTQDGLETVDEAMRLIGLVQPDEVIPWEDFIDQAYLPDGVEKIDPASVGLPR